MKKGGKNIDYVIYIWYNQNEFDIPGLDIT